MQYLLFFCFCFFAQPLCAKPQTQEELADRVIAGELSLWEYHKLRGSQVTEGHIYQGKTGQPKYFENLFAKSPWIKTIGEIGFNGGHSSNLFLRLAPESIVYAFDIMKHQYVKVGKEYVDLKYPGRHHLIPGDSRKSIPAYSMENPELVFDLIFIDGGHTYPIPYHDIVNMKAFAGPDTIVVLDDMQYKGVVRAYKECVEQNIITEGTFHKGPERRWVEFHYIFND